jgi:hypothetical protein
MCHSSPEQLLEALPPCATSSVPPGRLSAGRCADWDHRLAPGTHRLDDLGVVDALQVDRGDAEVAMAELALDDDQRHAFAGELDGVSVPELVRREPSPDPCLDGGSPQVRSGGGARPVPTACRAVDDAEQRPYGYLEPQLEPGLQLVPAPAVHADLATPSSLATTDEQGTASLIEIGLGKGERFLDAQPGSP